MRPILLVRALLLLLASGVAAAQQVYEIDAAASDIHWLVYKAGALARLGHNHVISVAELQGTVTVDATDLARSTFELEIPVAALVIDDPALRAGLGEEFSSVPTAEDIAGTRSNMLGERVLMAEEHPVLRLTGTGPTGVGETQSVRARVELLGRSVELELPARVIVDGESLEASGEFELTHTALGMQPFSVMMGALQVADGMSFSYRIRAHRAAAHVAK
jgi:polyisoprenoid-binding protein YceI